jgi:membrane-bound lytic murein transglycosylase B
MGADSLSRYLSYLFAVSHWFPSWLLVTSLSFSAQSAMSAPASEEFLACRASLGQRALDAGVSAGLVESALVDLEPLDRVIALDRRQPEFQQTFSEYLSTRVTAARISEGRERLSQQQSFLDSVLRQYGVPPRYLVAFWGLETNFGSYMGKVPTLSALATLACDERRSEFFAAEFVEALRLTEREGFVPSALMGSWAGAMGHTQFMPSSYMRYAVDGDADGVADLWRSERDALASGAHFLRELGWVPGERWGRAVTLPEGFPYEMAGLHASKRLSEWAGLGVMRADGGALPSAELEASLLLPAGYKGPAFLVYDNFRVIMRWNQSQSYALSVGLLADAIAGASLSLANFETEATLRSADLKAAQVALNDLGYDAGVADGILGRKTRAALRAYQLEQGLPADAYPGPETLQALLRP